MPPSDSCTAAKAPTRSPRRMHGKCLATAISTRRCRLSSSTPRGGACAHHRVERADRGARHEIARNKARRSRRHRESLHGDKVREGSVRCREATAAVFRRGPPLQDHGSVCRRRKLELARPRHTLRCYPYGFCNCLPQCSNLCLSPNNASRISVSRSRAFGVRLLRMNWISVRVEKADLIKC